MTDVNEHLIGHLKGRAIEGKDKYGVPLLAFNGRNPLKDKREELLDALVYNEQDILEREAVADLLERAWVILGSMWEFWESPGLVSMEEVAAIHRSLYDTAARLRQDIKRIEPEQTVVQPNYQCHSCGEFTATYTNGHRDICEKCWITTAGALHYQKFRLMPDNIVRGEDVTGQFVKRIWTEEEINARLKQLIRGELSVEE